MPTLSEIEGTKETKLSQFNISIDVCIALCHVVDDFESFIISLKEFTKPKYLVSSSRLKSLVDYIKKDEKYVNQNIINFYLNNRKVLDTIHEYYSYINTFLLDFYDIDEKVFNQEIMQMFEYIKNNKENKEKILANLEKLSQLGFDSITFLENHVFDEIYEFNRLEDIYYYLDGQITIIPGLENLKYKSNGANYEIEFNEYPYLRTSIYLNNLIFDSSLLPENLSYDATMKKIVDLKEKYQTSFKILDDCISLDYNLERILPVLDKIDEIIFDIYNCKYQSLAKEHIDKAKQSILELKWILANYEFDLVEDGLLEKDTLEEEKVNYKKRISD